MPDLPQLHIQLLSLPRTPSAAHYRREDIQQQLVSDRSSSSFHAYDQPSAISASIVQYRPPCVLSLAKVTVHSSPSPSSCARIAAAAEVAVKFLGFTIGLVGDSPPLLGWIRLDVELNKDFSNISGTVSFGTPQLICASFGISRLICASFEITRLICKGNVRGRPVRDKKDV
ncbi:hypothetical protein E6C27_scaffold102G001480 [Cucumis melo var. makuwa]|uniref:Uncharacterized protein n=1 Tax=Cucumis melo var. makuwa TaxID=1194695 RepID=A0A5A7UBR5_CUCMM|nr:hypothetical protein E6C27_scaffold102G001480 [Cucumis melo var. makuwa]